jgi:hypothetical protein
MVETFCNYYCAQGHGACEEAGLGGRVVIGVQDCAKFAGLAPKEILLGPSPSARHRLLQSCYLLNMWKGPKTVRRLIVADIRRWNELGAPDRAADAFLVLRQFLSDFPEARIEMAPVSTNNGAPRSRFQETRCRHGQSRSRRRAFKLISPEPSWPGSFGKPTQDGEV